MIQGRIDDGMAALDEAMAAATAGEAAQLETIGEVSCEMVRAAELIGEMERFGQWGDVIMQFVAEHGYMPLVAFCASCCGELLVGEGNWQEAERQLVDGLAALEASGQQARCVHPAAQLASLRALQGRLEEAEEILRPYEHLPESALPGARIALMQGRPSAARSWLTRQLSRLGPDTMLSVPLLSLLVEVQIAAGRLDEARETARRLNGLADLTGSKRVRALAAFAHGRVAAAAGDREAAELLQQASVLLADANLKLDAAYARLDLAKLLVVSDVDGATAEASSALAVFEELGAVRDADIAHRLVRQLGGRARTGPKQLGLLSKREIEVLRLIGHGLTNAEIADRLFISTKTAGHHVSNILSKLSLRSRSEAAAYAVVNLAKLSAPE